MAQRLKDDESIGLPAAAVRLGRPWWDVYNLALSGRLGSMERVGRQWRLSRASVERFARERDLAVTR